MNTATLQLIAFGSLAFVVGILLLVNMVRELTPDARRKGYLAIGLGSGVIAFGLKIGLIVVFSQYPSTMLALVPSKTYSRAPMIELAKQQHTVKAYTWQALPDIAPYPTDNLPSAQKIALGKKLFFDKRLSVDNSVSCASCHEVSIEKGGADGLTVSKGIDNQLGTRNAPTVLNAAFQRVLFWDGRAASLEEQAKGPLVNPVEMGMPSLEHVVQKVQALPEYPALFAKAFNTTQAINIDNIVKAIASYERTLITPNSAYDRFVKGEVGALSEQQIRGMVLFDSTGCVQCHGGPNFSQASLFENEAPHRLFPAVPNTEFETQYALNEDLGVASHITDAKRGVWRIPSLRNVSRTAPYFHNGSVTSLKEAVQIMARVQLNKQLTNKAQADKTIHWLDNNQQFSVSANQALSDAEIDDIVAFLEALDGELPNI